MLQRDIEAIDSSTPVLKKFGLTLGIFFGVVGILMYWRGRHAYVIFLILSLLFDGFGILNPRLLKPVHKIWMTFGLVMNWFVTRLILCIIFYLIITPIALLSKLVGQDFLRPIRTGWPETYWIQSKITKTDYEKYKNQF